MIIIINSQPLPQKKLLTPSFPSNPFPPSFYPPPPFYPLPPTNLLGVLSAARPSSWCLTNEIGTKEAGKLSHEKNWKQTSIQPIYLSYKVANSHLKEHSYMQSRNKRQGRQIRNSTFQLRAISSGLCQLKAQEVWITMANFLNML